MLGGAPLGSPLADRRAFMPPEPHLQPGNTLWDEPDEHEERWLDNPAERGGVPASLYLREPRSLREYLEDED